MTRPTDVDRMKADFLASRDRRDLVLAGHPTELTLELTSHCQLRCVTCPRETANRGALSKGNMDFAYFEGLASAHAPHLNYLNLAGGLGEPLLYPRLTDAARLVRRLNAECVTSISTNALLPRTPWVLAELAGVLSFVQISMDATGEAFDRIVGVPDSYPRFAANVRTAIAETRGTGTEVRFNCVVHSDNFRQIGAVIRSLAEWGGTRVYFNTFNLVSTDRPATDYDFYYSAEYLDGMVGAVELGRSLDVQVDYFDMRTVRDFSHCEYPWNNFYVSWDGWLVACCAKPFARLLNFGKVAAGRLMECVNHPNLVEFRRLWRDRVSPEYCRNCHYQHSGPAGPAPGRLIPLSVVR